MSAHWTKWTRRVILGAGIIFCVGAWAVCLIGYLNGVEKTTWVILITIAAIATEVLFWCVAAALGITVFEARRSILRSLGRLFRGRANQQSSSQS